MLSSREANRADAGLRVTRWCTKSPLAVRRLDRSGNRHIGWL